MTVKELVKFKMAQNHRQSRETKIITLINLGSFSFTFILARKLHYK